MSYQRFKFSKLNLQFFLKHSGADLDKYLNYINIDT